MIYKDLLSSIGNTPIIKIKNIAPKNINLFVKAEYFNPGGSVKDRLALSIIEKAEKEGFLKPKQTVVEATSGNTGIALVTAAPGFTNSIGPLYAIKANQSPVLLLSGDSPLSQKGLMSFQALNQTKISRKHILIFRVL